MWINGLINKGKNESPEARERLGYSGQDIVVTQTRVVAVGDEIGEQTQESFKGRIYKTY